ncbi:hypothetical protein BU24DRAFT_416051, partial [Aaosphaeria arxii CBS 175.79]
NSSATNRTVSTLLGSDQCSDPEDRFPGRRQHIYIYIASVEEPTSTSWKFDAIFQLCEEIADRIRNEIDQFPGYEYQINFLIRTLPHTSGEEPLHATVHFQTKDQADNGNYVVGHVNVKEQNRAYELATGDLSQDLKWWPETVLNYEEEQQKKDADKAAGIRKVA